MTADVVVAGVYLALGAAIVALALRRRRLSLALAPSRADAFSPGTGMLLAILMMVMAQVGAIVAREAGFGGAPGTAPADLTLAEYARLTLGAYAGQGVVAAVVAWLLLTAPRPEPDARPGVVAAAGRGLLYMVLFWPVVQVVSVGAAQLSELISGMPPDALAHQTLLRIVESPRDVWFAVTIASVTIGAPVLEETMYRGVVQHALRRSGLPPWTAVTMTSAVFVLMHATVVPPHALAPLFVLSLGFGWAYERTGRLAAPIVMHVLFNVANLVLAIVIASDTVPT